MLPTLVYYNLQDVVELQEMMNDQRSKQNFSFLFFFFKNSSKKRILNQSLNDVKH